MSPAWTSTPDADEAVRVRFWIEHLERSHALIERMAAYPVEECGEGFVSIRDAAGAAGVEMTFSTTKIGGTIERIFYIREGLIGDLIDAAREMNARGWIMKVEEGYRTRQMQTGLGRSPAVFDLIVRTCRRECGGAAPPVELVRRRSMCLVANYPLTGTHLFGAAVDISVFSRDTGREVWRGQPYLTMNETTPMLSPFVSPQEHGNRMAITAIMEKRGFLHYPGEFWHYNKGDGLYQMMMETGRPGRYGPVDWDPVSGRVTPFADITSPLTPPEIHARLIDEALARLGG